MDQQLPSSDSYLKLFRHATAFIIDVDGVLTDGSLLITDEGNLLRRMDIKDGYALHHAAQSGYPVMVISGGTSTGVEKRLQKLGVEQVYTGVADKKMLLLQLAEKFSLNLPTCIYIGDDIPDLEAMRCCGISCCPADAATEIKLASTYVSPFAGGEGCVRDIIEKVMKLQKKWL